MEDFLKQFKGYAPQLGHDYYGPRDNRLLKKTSFAEFVNTDTRDNFLKLAEGKSFTCKGAKVVVKRGLPQFYRHRDWAVRRAKEVLTAEYQNSPVETKREEKVRVVTVDGILAFSQGEKETEGSFVGAFAHLKLKA